MTINLLSGLIVTGLVGLGLMAARALIAMRKQRSAMKIPVRVRSYPEWKE